jgi:aryl-alcohol dehydrogenase-like predicted oxidoreductase
MSTDTLHTYPLCLGGNVFGWTADEAESYAILDRYVAAGGDFVDTADGYSHWVDGNVGGESEQVLGRWMTKRRNRSQVMIATKVGTLPSHSNLLPETIRGQLERSLRNLVTDYVDIYYTRGRDTDTPLQETTGTLAELVAEGKIRWLGVTNVTGPQLIEILQATMSAGHVMPVILSPKYNLVEREVYEDALAAVVDEYDLACAPYYGLAAGFLTGKYRDRGEAPNSARAPEAARHIHPQGIAVIDVVEAIAKDHGAANAAVALAWLRTRPHVIAPIASARNIAQLEQLLAVTTLELTPDELARLDDVSDPATHPR